MVPSKYRAVRTGKYASKKEAKRAWELQLLEKAGAITNLEEQVCFDLLPANREMGFPLPLRYRCDFSYLDHDKLIIEDVKGVKTDVYIIKRRLMKQLLGIEITEV